MRWRAAAGQAAVELLAALPVLLLAALMAWQLAVVGRAAVEAEEQLRRQGLRASGPAGSTVPLQVAVPVPGPLAAGVRVRAVGAVRLP